MMMNMVMMIKCFFGLQRSEEIPEEIEQFPVISQYINICICIHRYICKCVYLYKPVKKKLL